MVYIGYLHNCEMNEVGFRQILNTTNNLRRDVFKVQTPDCFANPGGIEVDVRDFFINISLNL